MNARSSADFRAKDGVHDLKSAQAPGVVPGVSDEHRQNAVMSVFNRLARTFSSGVFCFRLMLPMQACAVEGGH